MIRPNLTSAVICPLFFLVFNPLGTVQAQTDKTAQETVEIDEIIVTGSRIKRRNLISTSPVTQVDAEEFSFQGVTRVEDLLNNLPQTVAGQSSFVNNGSTGTATVDLRGLSADRTLTLLNGRRLPSGSPIELAADINQIPGMLIERVEILTGGASATYGSDAIAGVVNFITIDDFEGLQFDYQLSQYRHDNDSPLAQLVEEAGYELPASSVSDGETHNFSLIAGFDLPNGRGNLTAYAGWRDVKGVTESERDYSACALDADMFCGGSIVIPDGYFTDFGLLTHPDCVLAASPTPEDPNAMTCNRIPAFDYATGQPTGEVDSDGNLVMMNEPVLPWFGNSSGSATMPWPGTFDYLVEPGTDTFVDWDGHPNAFYNYAPHNYYMRPDERITAGLFGHYDLGRDSEFYLELNYMNDKSVAQLAPSGSFFLDYTVHCDNPLLSQQQFDLICGRFNLAPSDSQLVFINRRNAEGGPRRAEWEHTQYRAVLGVRGDLGATWSYDGFVNYSEVQFDEVFDEDLSITRMTRAIDVVTNPVSGQAVCRSTLEDPDDEVNYDPDCVPWNIFESGAVTDAAVDYITIPLFFDGSTRQLQSNVYVSADLGDYGVRLPGADDGIKFVLGLEYRDDHVKYNPDPRAESGDVSGFGGSDPPVSAGYSVKEIFTEASVPLLQGKPAAELVSIDAAYRYSYYSTDKQTDTYKVAGEWSPVPALRFRASFQRAVRVGNVNELFSPLQEGVDFGAVDSCEGPNPTATLEQCQNTGLSASLYGTKPEDFAWAIKSGGNPELDPEESDTVSYGLIITPEFIPQLSISVDYFDIDVEGAIDGVDAGFVFDQCIETGQARYCDSIHRDPVTGSLAFGGGYVDVRNRNIAALKTSGVDAVADYLQPIGRFGDVQFTLVGTYMDSLQVQALPGQVPMECAGTYTCWGVLPELATNLRATWITPWDASISLLWRHMSKVTPEEESSEWYQGFDLPSTDYFDLAAVWDPTDSVSLRFGINNLFDEDPPICPCSTGNTLPTFYDALGRYLFAGVNFRL
jgi:outer membrane receptor protein involved in Fe transport